MTVAESPRDSRMRPPRLSRLDQLFPGFSIYFVTCCTHERRRLLADPILHESFRTFCLLAQNRHVSVGRYVLMPDHLHFFVDCGEEIHLSIWMKSLKNALLKTLRGLGHPAPHWQKGFFDHVVRSEQSYEEKWRYSVENPVRAKLVSKAQDWP